MSNEIRNGNNVLHASVACKNDLEMLRLKFIAIECFTGECCFRSYQIISFNEKSFAIFLS